MSYDQTEESTNQPQGDQIVAPSCAFDVVNIFKLVHEDVPGDYIYLVFHAAMRVYYRDRFGVDYKAEQDVAFATTTDEPPDYGIISGSSDV